ncbi:hypothetical protein NKG94_46710 [Micromonospora sp. M12]
MGRLDRDGTAAILTDLLGAEPIARPSTTSTSAPRAIPSSSRSWPSPVTRSAARHFRRRCATCCWPGGPAPRAGPAGPADRRGRGTRFAHDLLAEVAGLPEAELEDALRATVAAQLVVADRDGDYEFRHALVREAVHDELLPGEHARLHARFAAAIEAQPHLVAVGRAPAEIAHHWYAAHDHPRALVAARAAAAPPPTGTRTPSSAVCWSGRWSCGSWCRTPRPCWTWTTWRCWSRRWARRSPPVTSAGPSP